MPINKNQFDNEIKNLTDKDVKYSEEKLSRIIENHTQKNYQHQSHYNFTDCSNSPKYEEEYDIAEEQGRRPE